MSADAGCVPPGSDGGSGPIAAVQALYDAILDADIDGVLASYEADAALTVFVEGPRWLTVGFDAVARGWRAFGASPQRLTGIDIVDGPYLTEVGDLAVVAQIVSLTVVVDGQDRTMQMRMTHVMRRGGDDRWRTVHEHASQPLADPYGTGDWLVQG